MATLYWPVRCFLWIIRIEIKERLVEILFDQSRWSLETGQSLHAFIVRPAPLPWILFSLKPLQTWVYQQKFERLAVAEVRSLKSHLLGLGRLAKYPQNLSRTNLAGSRAFHHPWTSGCLSEPASTAVWNFSRCSAHIKRETKVHLCQNGSIAVQQRTDFTNIGTKSDLLVELGKQG